MLKVSLKTLPEYKQVCENINPVYVDIIFSYLAEIKYDYYPSGKIADEVPILNIGSEDGKIHGTKKLCYKSGKIFWEIPYINAQIHGLKKEYYLSGQIKVETPYTNGEIHGIKKVYYKSGKIKSETLYENGKLI
jgi:antitoxin component YwqK of YwqJK toxin-antitoxin module